MSLNDVFARECCSPHEMRGDVLIKKFPLSAVRTSQHGGGKGTPHPLSILHSGRGFRTIVC